jgi:uncharacterized protein YciI
MYAVISLVENSRCARGSALLNPFRKLRTLTLNAAEIEATSRQLLAFLRHLILVLKTACLMSASAVLLSGLAAKAADSTELYQIVFLHPDPARKALSNEEGERIQAAHMANIHSMAERGVLVAAGPFDDKPATISGLFLFRTPSFEEAQGIADLDPTVVAHRNRVEVHDWHGPKGIGDEYFRLHKQNPDTPEGMGVQPLFLLYRGTAWSGSGPALADHNAYLERLRREGKIAMAGRTEGEDVLSEVVVFHRIGDEEAQRLMAADPAVQANVLSPEYHRWFCAEHVIPNSQVAAGPRTVE